MLMQDSWYIKRLTDEIPVSTVCSSDDALKLMRYALYDIFGLSEREVSNLFCKAFLIKTNLYRFYLRIKSPIPSIEVKEAYILSLLCPSIYTFDKKGMYISAYKGVLKDCKADSLFLRYKDKEICLIAMRYVLSLVFEGAEGPSDYLYFADSHKEEMISIIRLFKLYDFYDFFCDSPLDFIFYSLSHEEKKESLTTYLELKEEEYTENEGMRAVLKATEKQLMEHKYREIRTFDKS